MYDDIERIEVEDFMDYLEECLRETKQTISSDQYELVLDVGAHYNGTRLW